MDLGDVIGRKNAIIDRFRKFWLDFLVSLEIRTRQIFALQFRFERSSSFLFLLLNIYIYIITLNNIAPTWNALKQEN